MAFYFRKSINIDPIRISTYKGRIGVPGTIVGKTARGKTYVSGGVPGSGFGYRKYFGVK